MFFCERKEEIWQVFFFWKGGGGWWERTEEKVVRLEARLWLV